MSSLLKNPPPASPTATPEIRSVGFPRSPAATASTSTASASGSLPHATPPITGPNKPIAKRPKGRLFISVVILSLVGFVGYTVWCEFLAYQAYGEIAGRVLQLSPSASGTIVSIHARDGEVVHSGQVLALLRNHELERERLHLRSEMAMALASLQVKLTEVETLHHGRVTDSLEREAEYFQLLSDWHAQQSRLAELQHTLGQNEILIQSNAVSEHELFLSKTAVEGLQVRVKDTESALEKLRASFADAPPDSTKLASAELSRLRALQLDFERLSQMDVASEIRAPTNGRIVRRAHFTGEYVRPADVVFELLEEGSMEAVVYVTQAQAKRWRVGQAIELTMQPNKGRQPFKVVRLGDRMVQPPPHLFKYYRAHQTLLPIHCEPIEGWSSNETSSRWLGAEVALPTLRSGIWSLDDSSRPQQIAGRRDSIPTQHSN